MRDREKEKSMSYIKNADIQGNAWVAPGACIVGNVTLGDEVLYGIMRYFAEIWHRLL